jgi:Pseudouridylate synthases, 23S RNA-specific
MTVPVLHVDAWLAVVNKPPGVMIHPSPFAGGEKDFLVDRLRAQFGRQVFVAHRLDRATSGCLLLAFDHDTASALGRQMMSREVRKEYLAVCRGWPEERFTVDHAIDGGPGKPRKKPAVTHFERLATVELDMPSARFPTSRYALLRAMPETGRFRQIRRHLRHASHPLVGDTSHGDSLHNRNFKSLGIHRMLLHAWRLGFTHPGTGERVTVEAPPDGEFMRAVALFPDAPDLAGTAPADMAATASC